MNEKETNNVPGGDKPIRVLVAGATGYLGSLIVESCKLQGFWVRALARDVKRLKVRALCDDVFVGEATKNETLEGLCDGIDVVFSSVGFMTFAKKPSIWEVDYEANMNILKRAKAAGVKHFIYTSTVGCNEMAKNVKIAQAKQAIGKELEKSGMRWTVMEPTGFFDDMRKLYDSVMQRGTAFVFGNGQTKLNPIHGVDLANGSVQAIKDESMWNKYVPIGGPEVFTHAQIAKMIFDIQSKPPKIKHIPIWLLKVISVIARPINKNLADMLWFFIAIGSIPDLSAPLYGDHHLKDFFMQIHNGAKEA